MEAKHRRARKGAADFERSMKPTTQSPKDGAQRKREFDQRKRAQGLKEFRAWVSEDEARQLRGFLGTIRADLLENDDA